MDWLHIFIHAIKETAILLPFLFFTYLFLEWLEHRGAEKMEGVLRKSGKIAPVFGALLGIVPQCGFSASAAGLYAGRVISLGTLVAVFLSTSDEMLPVLVAGGVGFPTVLLVLGIKVAVAILAGYLIDLLYRPAHEHTHRIGEMCEHEHCHCEKGIWYSALMHTLQIAGFILLVNLAFGAIIEGVGEEAIANFVAKRGFLAYLLSSMIGLIPNCASSVILAELHVKGIILPGMMLAGLLPGAGVGSVVLLRTNRPVKQSLLILLLLLAVGVGVGLATDLLWGIIA